MEGDETVESGRRYRSIWISDVHLGTRHARAEVLLEFLRDTEAETLYLVGDFIDAWQFKRLGYWAEPFNTVIQKLLRKARKGTRVVYVTGNHDEFLEEFSGFSLGGVRFAREAVHCKPDGTRYLVIHGHQFDGLSQFSPWLERVGSHLYQWVLEANYNLNRVRRRFGFGYWSLASRVKYCAKSAVKYLTHYEQAMVGLARSRGFDGIVCGHIHRPEIKQIEGMEYLNCGDWLESCSALVEHSNGNIELIRYDENPFHRSGRGTRAYDPSSRSVRTSVPVGA